MTDSSRLRPVNCTRCPELGNVPAIAVWWPPKESTRPNHLALCNSCSVDLMWEGLSIIQNKGTDPRLLRKQIEKGGSSVSDATESPDPRGAWVHSRHGCAKCGRLRVFHIPLVVRTANKIEPHLPTIPEPDHEFVPKTDSTSGGDAGS